MAAVLAVFIGIGYFAYTTFFEDKMIVLTTAAGERISHYLPDSSQVWLNENSQLAYAEDFSAAHRIVRLTGEGFFEVRKAEGKRFTVLTEEAKTEVIGTSFNVRAYPDEDVKVQVVSGKVAFSPRNEDNSVFLEPGFEGLLEKDKVPEKSAIEDPNFRAWQNHELIFNNTSLQQLAQTLEAYFNISMHIDNPNLANCRFTATFDQPDITEILKVLSITGNLTYDQQGNQYTLQGNGCQ
jgi:ferric-dicitrate binding protein FerR (iron transport regulator)